jgi:hypothetical protein
MLRFMLHHRRSMNRSMNRSIGAKTGINLLAAMQFPGTRAPLWSGSVVILLHCTI